ncbi:MAG: M28 family peptidase [Vicinamibacterales bacterium]
MSARRTLALAVAVILLAAAGCAADPMARITEDDLRSDLFALAGDATRGREGGTIDELTASAWLAARAREAGLEPAGDGGSYFQFFPLERFRVSAGSRVTIGGRTLEVGPDVVPDAPLLAEVDAPVLMAADASPAAIDRLALGGRALAVRYAPAAGGAGPRALTQWTRTVTRAVANRASAVIVVVPDTPDTAWDRVSFRLPRGSYGLDPDGTAAPRTGTPGMPVLYVREAALDGAALSGARIRASIFTETFTYPSVNVIARVRGRDGAVSGEHVLFSAHQDHDGVRYAVDGDAIWNGADDNASTAVALLAIGRAFAASPAPRSALFIWHGAEERGLMGSRWYVAHPTVPKASIVAVLNGDMIGRNAPDTAALLGAVPPHRNSAALVRMALDANERVSGFTVDSSWDDPDHREGWYYRSDHLPYARAGIPALFFTTLLHDDYHTPFDNPDRIDIAKLAKMTRWMYATGRAVAEADAPPALDPDFTLERCRDYTGNYCGG